MKKKYITLALIFFTQLCVFAQEWTGTFSTKYGDLKLVTENGIIYGDYANGGTILAVEKKFNGGSRLCGLFHNGADRGRFYFEKTTSSKNIRGHFNYDNNITLNDITNDAIFTMKFDFDAKWLWDGTKANNTSPTDTKTAVFNGLWNTTDGNLILQQVGNKVTGTYKNVGTVDGIYNPQTKKLKGTFYNNTTKKTGHFEFDFEGNTFKGKWGWTTAMTDGSWNGTKNIKNNKVVVTASTTETDNTNSSQSQNNQKVKYRFYLAELQVPYVATISNPLSNLYGFSGIRMYRVTTSGREEIKSFGSKSQTFFDRTEDNAFPENRESVSLPETPANYRDFEFLSSDINNNNVDIEVQIWHHLKGKRPGINADYGKTRQTLTMEQIISAVNSNGMNKIYIGSSCELGKIKERNQSYVLVLVKKID